MAITKVDEKCLMCGTKIQPGDKVHFICMVQTTDENTAGFYGGKNEPIKKGKLRIKHLPGGKPRGLICPICVKEFG